MLCKLVIINKFNMNIHIEGRSIRVETIDLFRIFQMELRAKQGKSKFDIINFYRKL